MSAHAKLSPSSAERWINCPGSVNLIATLPPSAFKPSKYAAEGTVAHTIGEAYVQKKIDLMELMSLVGQTRQQEGFEIEITDSMVEGVLEYADAIAAVRQRMTKRIEVVERFEAKVKASTVGEDLWGTADCIIFQRGHELHVIDFKFGKGVVEAEENAQGKIYLVAAQDSEAGNAFDRVYFHIVQPRARHSDGTWRTWELPAGRLVEFRKELTEAVARTRMPNAPRKAGGWCHKYFCPALAYCPEAAGAVQAAAQTEFTKIPYQGEMAAAMVLPPVATLTPQQVAKALDWEDAIDAYFEAIRARALAELMANPLAVPGYKIVEGKTNRAWSSETQVDEAFRLLGEQRYAPRKLLSPAQMEKIGGKDEVAKYTVKPQGKPTVVKTSDKREAISPNESAKDVFAPVDDNPYASRPLHQFIDPAVLPKPLEVKEKWKLKREATEVFMPVEPVKKAADPVTDNIFGDLVGPPADKRVWP